MTDDDLQDKEPNPIKYHPLHELHKQTTSEDTQVGKATTDYMQQQLESVARAMIKTAEDKAKEDDSATIRKEHAEAAYEEVFAEYRVIDEAIAALGEYESNLKRIGSRTNVLQYETEDE
jgi:histone H3/H4